MAAKKLVVVEDEPILLKALNIELLGAKYQVLSATDGKAALALIKKEKPAAVLLDLMLPKMNGFDVLKAVKADKTTKHIPVVILSNLGSADDRKKAKELGAKDYYVKSSTDLSDLVKKVGKLLK